MLTSWSLADGDDVGFEILAFDDAGIADLAAGFGVERGDVKGDVAFFVDHINGFAIDE